MGDLVRIRHNYEYNSLTTNFTFVKHIILHNDEAGQTSKPVEFNSTSKPVEFEYIPLGIQGLVQLISLHMIGFRYDNSFNIGNLHNLRTLNFSNNELKLFPLQICELRRLETLSITSNNISDIPRTISNLCNLKVLDLSKNKIRLLPTEICQLTKLETLNIKYNNITAIPLEICKLVNLQVLEHDV
jgi:Leucine-rich repeat (LRR) protein